MMGLFERFGNTPRGFAENFQLSLDRRLDHVFFETSIERQTGRVLLDMSRGLQHVPQMSGIAPFRLQKSPAACGESHTA